jgi:hypothetical protein
MKIVSKKVIQECIGHDYENTSTHWCFRFEPTDFDEPSMIDRFEWVNVEQREYPNDTNCAVFREWFKGTRTNNFTIETKDRQKQKVIAIINRYLLDNNTPLITYWVEPRNL